MNTRIMNFGLVFGFLAFSASAATCTWIGGSSGDLFTDTNWNQGFYPKASDAAVFSGVGGGITLSFTGVGADGVLTNYAARFETATGGNLVNLNGWRWVHTGLINHISSDDSTLTIENGYLDTTAGRTFTISNINPQAWTRFRNGGEANVAKLSMPVGTLIIENGGSVTVTESAEINGTLLIKEGGIYDSVSNTRVGNLANAENAKIIVDGGFVRTTAMPYIGTKTAHGEFIISNGVVNLGGQEPRISGPTGSQPAFTNLFAIRGGVVSNGSIRVGSDSAGLAEISGGNVLLKNILVGSGAGGDGTLQIGGGTIDLSTGFVLGNSSPTATGAVVITGGKITTPQYLDQNAGPGTFTLKDGDVTINYIRSGVNAASTGDAFLKVNVEGGILRSLGNCTFDSSNKGTLTEFNLSGGTLLFSQNFAPGAKNVIFNFTGGVLSVPSLFPSTQGDATFYNRGGTLAPGGIGQTSSMILNGLFVVDSPDAGWDFDIAAAGTYDAIHIRNNGVCSLGGKLNIRLINNFRPNNTTFFSLLRYDNAGNSLADGTWFNNVADGETLFTEDGLYRFTVTNNLTDKMIRILNGTPNIRNIPGGDWSEGWSLVTPGDANNYAAYLGPEGSGTVVLNDALILQGLIFTNETGYAIAGGGSLDLGYIKVQRGNHTVNVPLTQSQDLMIDVPEGTSLTLGTLTGGQSMTKTGAGTLYLNGASVCGGLSIQGGMLSFGSTLLVSDGLILAEGTVLNFAMKESSLTIKGTDENTLRAWVSAGQITQYGRTVKLRDFKIKTLPNGYLFCEIPPVGTCLMLQ